MFAFIFSSTILNRTDFRSETKMSSSTSVSFRAVIILNDDFRGGGLHDDDNTDDTDNADEEKEEEEAVAVANDVNKDVLTEDLVDKDTTVLSKENDDTGRTPNDVETDNRFIEGTVHTSSFATIAIGGMPT